MKMPLIYLVSTFSFCCHCRTASSCALLSADEVVVVAAAVAEAVDEEDEDVDDPDPGPSAASLNACASSANRRAAVRWDWAVDSVCCR